MYYEGYTPDGTSLLCDCDKGIVIYNDGEITFKFSPDFPQDAKKLFEAMCEVREIIIEE